MNNRLHIAMNERKTHKYGIDLLRLIAFAYVVVLHTLGHGGIIQASPYGSHQYMLCAGLEIWSYCAVNLFGLISGYVGYSPAADKPWKKHLLSYLRLWLHVVFFAVVPSVIVFFAVPGTISPSQILEGFFPVTTGQYWYFSAYTGLFLLMPVLNAALRSLDSARLKHFLFLFLIVFSLYASPMERFALREGYSTFWLVLLYLAGGAVRKIQSSADETQREEAVGSRTGSGRICLYCLAGIIICALFAWIWLIRDWHLTIFETEIKRTSWMSYTSFTVTLSAMLHLILCSKIRIPGKLQNFVKKAAACSFGIYLLNTQPAVWKLTNGIFASYAAGPLVHILLVVAANVVVFMAGGILTDFVLYVLSPFRKHNHQSFLK